MSQLQKLRKWADFKGLEIDTSSRDKQWYMSIQLEHPVKFKASSGWVDTTEEAAGKLISLLEEVGEDLNVGTS